MTLWRIRNFEIAIGPLLAIVEREPSTILIFLFPTHGLLEENTLEHLIIWSVAPEYMVYGKLEVADTLNVTA